MAEHLMTILMGKIYCQYNSKQYQNWTSIANVSIICVDDRLKCLSNDTSKFFEYGSGITIATPHVMQLPEQPNSVQMDPFLQAILSRIHIEKIFQIDSNTECLRCERPKEDTRITFSLGP